MAQRGETDWQQYKSVLECNRYMLESAIAADVIFHLHSPDGDTADIPAHKYMLISRSPVFEALFCGGFSNPGQNVGGKVEIPDVEPDAFKELLKYLYYEEVNLVPDNVLPILYAAKKYLLLPLAKKCMDFLERKISASTVCTILNHSILYDEKELTEKCIGYIAPRCSKVIKCDSFLSLSQNAVSRMLSCDHLYVESELELLASCIRWATKRAEDNNPNGVEDSDLRAQLGDNLGKIRFASMTAAEFATSLGKRGILTDNEKSLFYYYLLTGEDEQCLSQLGFDLSPRVRKCVRYPCLGRTAGWWTCNGPGDAISFSVSKPITLVGVSVYGGREPGVHHVTFELWRNPDVLIKRSEHSVVSEGKEYPLPVYIGDGGADILPDEGYTLLTTMRGPIAYYGQGGTEVIAVMDVTFTFSRSEKSGNGTNIKSGQIPELLFLPHKTTVHEI